MNNNLNHADNTESIWLFLKHSENYHSIGLCASTCTFPFSQLWEKPGRLWKLFCFAGSAMIHLEYPGKFSPVRKTRMSPSGSFKWTSRATFTAWNKQQTSQNQLKSHLILARTHHTNWSSPVSCRDAENTTQQLILPGEKYPKRRENKPLWHRQSCPHPWGSAGCRISPWQGNFCLECAALSSAQRTLRASPPPGWLTSPPPSCLSSCLLASPAGTASSANQIKYPGRKNRNRWC